MRRKHLAVIAALALALAGCSGEEEFEPLQIDGPAASAEEPEPEPEPEVTPETEPQSDREIVENTVVAELILAGLMDAVDRVELGNIADDGEQRIAIFVSDEDGADQLCTDITQVIGASTAGLEMITEVNIWTFSSFEDGPIARCAVGEEPFSDFIAKLEKEQEELGWDTDKCIEAIPFQMWAHKPVDLDDEQAFREAYLVAVEFCETLEE